MRTLLFFSVFGTLSLQVWSRPGLASRQFGSPSVAIQGGTIIGSSRLGIDSFQGIPFARPPTGNLRLRPPQPLTGSFDLFDATKTPAQCPQFGLPSSNVDATEVIPQETRDKLSQLINLDTSTASQGQEDCLTLNIQRPSSATNTSSLPVLVWIYGGGWVSGSASKYDGSSLIHKSISLGSPIIYVAINYRLGGFGFLAGKDLQQDGSTNLGLRDQRLALEWIHDNIVGFGGDPEKVTIWGESAGSASVFDQLLVNSGNHSHGAGKLFRGAIMNSGSIFSTRDVASSVPQSVYDSVVSLSGCSDRFDSLQCLREVPYQTLYNAMAANLGTKLVNTNWFPRPDPDSNFFPLSPELATAQGKIARVPFIIGNQEDEGSIFTFSRRDVSAEDDVINILAEGFETSSRGIVTDLVKIYPSDPVAGSPFRTGPLNEVYPQYKRLSAIFGDIFFTLTRRHLLSCVSDKVKTWSYLSSYDYGTPVLGTTHGTDILAIYYGLGSPIPIESIRGYYVSFVATLDPNGLKQKSKLRNWPSYETTSRQLLNFNAASNDLINDTFRSKASDFLDKAISQLQI